VGACQNGESVFPEQSDEASRECRFEVGMAGWEREAGEEGCAEWLLLRPITARGRNTCGFVGMTSLPCCGVVDIVQIADCGRVIRPYSRARKARQPSSSVKAASQLHAYIGELPILHRQLYKSHFSWAAGLLHTKTTNIVMVGLVVSKISVW
jgi:hypothetical protein